MILLPILPIPMILVGIIVFLGIIIETLVLYPRLSNEAGKKIAKAQTLWQRKKYLVLYKKICVKEGSSLFFYNTLLNLDKYGILLVKIIFLIVFLQIGIVVVTGFLNGQLRYV